jgi:hypothetical protein
MKEKRAGRSGRRTFLMGLVTGAGVTTALGVGRPGAAGARSAKTAPGEASSPILYRRTEGTERYYRTLYR